MQSLSSFRCDYNHLSYIFIPCMHRLFKLLTGPFKQSQQNPPVRFPLIDDIYPRQLPLHISPADTFNPINLHLSLQHMSKQKSKSTLKINEKSASQRKDARRDCRSNSIRISKNTYKTNNRRPSDSHITIGMVGSTNALSTTDNLHHSNNKHITLILNPEKSSKRSIHALKKNYQAVKHQAKKQEVSEEVRKGTESKRKRHKQCRMLSLVGTGCRINQAIGVNTKKALRLSQLRTLDS